MENIVLASTDVTRLFFIADPAQTDGSGKTGLNAAALKCSYTRVETDNDVVVTDVTSSLSDLSALTDAHTDWGVKEVSSTLAPGLYRLDIADAPFATGAVQAVVYLWISSSDAAPSPKDFKLIDVTSAQLGVNVVNAGGTAWGSGAITASVIADNAIDAASIASDAITAAKIATGAITSAKFAAGAIDAAAIADGAIDAATFAAGAITATVIATDAIDADALADGAITAATFAAGAITATVIATDAIDADAMADGAITEGTFANNAITDAKVASDVTIASVTGAVGSVTGNVGGNVTGSVGSVATGGIAAASFAAGAIDAAAIAANAIGASELAADAANEIADAILDRTNGIETSYTLRQSIRLILSAAAAKLSGAGTTTVAIRDVGDAKDRITATVDADGNRTAVTLDAT